LEDQTLEDAKLEKPKSKVTRNSYLDTSPMVYDNSVANVVDKNVKADTNEDHVSSSNNDQREDSDESDSTESEVLKEPQLRRSTRERRPYIRYGSDEYITLIDEGEPQSYKKAIINNHKA